MTDIVGRLRSAALDKDNFPRMGSERWLPVGLGLEAADEIERLRAKEAALKLLIISAGRAHEIGFRKTDIWDAFGRDLEDARAILAEVKR